MYYCRKNGTIDANNLDILNYLKSNCCVEVYNIGLYTSMVCRQLDALSGMPAGLTVVTTAIRLPSDCHPSAPLIINNLISKYNYNLLILF